MADADPLADEPFSFHQTRDGVVRISCAGRMVKTLRGAAAARFMAKIESADARAAQLLMAKATGQFKFGNERSTKDDRR